MTESEPLVLITEYYSKTRAGTPVLAWLKFEPEPGHGYKIYSAHVHFEGLDHQMGNVDHVSYVGTQGSINALQRQLLHAAEGIAALLDSFPKNPEKLLRGVKDCINSLYRQTKDLEFNTEPPF